MVGGEGRGGGGVVEGGGLVPNDPDRGAGGGQEMV